MKKFTYLFLALAFCFTFSNANAQFDKESCQAILKGYNKSNTAFKTMHVATANFSSVKQKYDLSYLEKFEFVFEEKYMQIVFISKSSPNEYRKSIPYSEIRFFNTAPNAVDIIIKN